jgi:hypothetical protein
MEFGSIKRKLSNDSFEFAKRSDKRTRNLTHEDYLFMANALQNEEGCIHFNPDIDSISSDQDEEDYNNTSSESIEEEIQPAAEREEEGQGYEWCYADEDIELEWNIGFKKEIVHKAEEIVPKTTSELREAMERRIVELKKIAESARMEAYLLNKQLKALNEI